MRANRSDAVSAVFGSGVVRERIITLPPAERVRIEGSLRAVLRVDPAHEDDLVLRFRADDNLLHLLRARVEDGVIVLGLADGAYADLTELSVRATVGSLTEIASVDAAIGDVSGLAADCVTLDSAGASRLRVRGTAREWSASARGQSQIRAALGATARVVVHVRDASEVHLEGAADELALYSEGAGRIAASAPSFEVKRARVELDGFSSARVGAREDVHGRVSFPSRLILSSEGRVEIEGAYVRA